MNQATDEAAEPAPGGYNLVAIDTADLTPEQQEHVRVMLLLTEVGRLTAQARRLVDPHRNVLLRLRDGKRARELLHRADTLLAEAAGLRGWNHTPVPRSSSGLLRSPLTWWCVRWVVGIWNASSMVGALVDRHWLAAGASALALLLCALWKIPPYRLAKLGRWG